VVEGYGHGWELLSGGQFEDQVLAFLKANA
jgi:hypothetical protein